MQNIQLIEKINILPAMLKAEVNDFVDFLMMKNKIEAEPKRKAKFGSLKGEKMWMSPDFDAPLEDFKDYM